MKIEEFKNLIQRLKNKNLSGRHLYIWNSKEDNLYPLILENITDKLDILQIINELDEDINDEKTIKKMLRENLESKLSNWYQNRKNILVIISVYLLIRYNISPNIFYDYLSDNKMIILVIPNFYYSGKLPDYVEYNPRYVLNKITDIIGEDKVLEE